MLVLGGGGGVDRGDWKIKYKCMWRISQIESQTTTRHALKHSNAGTRVPHQLPSNLVQKMVASMWVALVAL